MTAKNFMMIFWIYFSLATVSMAQAHEQDRFCGSIGFGGIFTRERSDARIDDLNGPPDPNVRFDPIIYPDLTYDMGEPQGLKFFLNSNPPITEAGDWTVSVGSAYKTALTGTLKLSAFFSPFEDAWQNPYETQTKRKLTDKNIFGLTAGVSQIGASNLGLNWVVACVDVKDDLIGRMMPKLQRDGNIYALKLKYSVYPLKNCEIRPLFSVLRGIYAGDANSFFKYKMGVEPRYILGGLFLLPQIYYSRIIYDTAHPIFNRKPKNEIFGVSLKANYPNPFGLNRYSLQMLLSYNCKKSNVAFFDNESISAGTFLSYHF